jgi:argininosuccinate synthase
LARIEYILLFKQVIIDDLRAEFVRDFAWPGVACGLRYEGRYLLGTSLARPAICRGLVRAAQERSVKMFSHGATSKGNDQVRFELGCSCIAPEMKVSLQ